MNWLEGLVTALEEQSIEKSGVSKHLSTGLIEASTVDDDSNGPSVSYMPLCDASILIIGNTHSREVDESCS